MMEPRTSVASKYIRLLADPKCISDQRFPVANSSTAVPDPTKWYRSWQAPQPAPRPRGRRDGEVRRDVLLQERFRLVRVI